MWRRLIWGELLLPQGRRNPSVGSRRLVLPFLTSGSSQNDSPVQSGVTQGNGQIANG